MLHVVIGPGKASTGCVCAWVGAFKRVCECVFASVCVYTHVLQSRIKIITITNIHK